MIFLLSIKLFQLYCERKLLWNSYTGLQMPLSLISQLYEEDMIIYFISQIWARRLNVGKQRVRDYSARFRSNLCLPSSCHEPLHTSLPTKREKNAYSWKVDRRIAEQRIWRQKESRSKGKSCLGLVSAPPVFWEPCCSWNPVQVATYSPNLLLSCKP